MSTGPLQFLPAYKLTVHVPSSTDGTETAILQPPFGAPHSDNFVVATIYGVAGARPFLDLPTGIKQQFDPLTGKNTIGSMNFTIIDLRLGTGNSQRWVTAFLGDIYGSNSLIGRWASVEESLDNGITWSAFYAGRITRFQLSTAGQWHIEVTGGNEQLQWPIFTQRPAYGPAYSWGKGNGPSGSAMATLVPNGITMPWGLFSSSFWEPCVVAGAAPYNFRNGSASFIAFTRLEIDNPPPWIPAGSLPQNVDYETPLIQSMLTSTKIGENSATVGVGATYFNRIIPANALSALSLGYGRIQCYSPLTNNYAEYTLVAYNATPEDGHNHFAECFGWEVSGSDPYYGSASLFAVNTPVTIRIVPHALPISDKNPIFLSGNPALIMKQAALGYYGYTYYGAPASSMSINTTAFNNILTGSWNPVRYMVTKQIDKVADFFDQYIYWSGIGYTTTYAYQNGVSGKVQAYLTPFDNRLPTVVNNLLFLTDDDVQDVMKPTTKWDLGKPYAAIEITSYVDQPVAQPTFTDNTHGALSSPSWGFITAENATGLFFPDNVTGTPNVMQVDAKGCRYPAIASDLTSSFVNYNFADPAAAYVTQLGAFLGQRFAGGPETVTYRCRRTSNVQQMTIGQYIIVSMSTNPDPATAIRGNDRLMQVTELSNQGGLIDIGLMAAGRPVFAPMCWFLSESLISSTVGNNAIKVTLTGSFGDVKMSTEIQMALEIPGAPQPNVTSSDWVTVVAYNQAWNPTLATEIVLPYQPNSPQGSFGTASFYIQGVKGNKWAYLRARDYYTNNSYLPSAWSYPPGGFVTTYVIPPITALTASANTLNSITLTWSNNGDNSDPIHIALASPNTSPLQAVALLPPGQTSVYLAPIDSSSTGNPHLAAAYHVDQAGGLSIADLFTWDTTAIGTPGNLQAPAPLRLYIEDPGAVAV